MSTHALEVFDKIKKDPTHSETILKKALTELINSKTPMWTKDFNDFYATLLALCLSDSSHSFSAEELFETVLFSDNNKLLVLLIDKGMQTILDPYNTYYNFLRENNCFNDKIRNKVKEIIEEETEFFNNNYLSILANCSIPKEIQALAIREYLAKLYNRNNEQRGYAKSFDHSLKPFIWYCNLPIESTAENPITILASIFVEEENGHSIMRLMINNNQNATLEEKINQFNQEVIELVEILKLKNQIEAPGDWITLRRAMDATNAKNILLDSFNRNLYPIQASLIVKKEIDNEVIGSDLYTLMNAPHEPGKGKQIANSNPVFFQKKTLKRSYKIGNESYQKVPILGDGNCAFSALETDRITFAKTLKNGNKNSEYRAVIWTEIYEAALDKNNEKLIPKEKSEAWAQLSQRIVSTEEDDKRTAEFMNALKAKDPKAAKYDGKHEELIEYLGQHHSEEGGWLEQYYLMESMNVSWNKNREIFSSEEAFTLYLDVLESTMLWAGYKSMVLYAQIKGINLYIYQAIKSTDSCKEVEGYFYPKNDKTIRLIHTRKRTHFDCLQPEVKETEAPAETSVASSIAEKVFADIMKNPANKKSILQEALTELYSNPTTRRFNVFNEFYDFLTALCSSTQLQFSVADLNELFNQSNTPNEIKKHYKNYIGLLQKEEKISIFESGDSFEEFEDLAEIIENFNESKSIITPSDLFKLAQKHRTSNTFKLCEFIEKYLLNVYTNGSLQYLYLCEELQKNNEKPSTINLLRKICELIDQKFQTGPKVDLIFLLINQMCKRSIMAQALKIDNQNFETDLEAFSKSRIENENSLLRYTCLLKGVREAVISLEKTVITEEDLIEQVNECNGDENKEKTLIRNYLKSIYTIEQTVQKAYIENWTKENRLLSHFNTCWFIVCSKIGASKQQHLLPIFISALLEPAEGENLSVFQSIEIKDEKVEEDLDLFTPEAALPKWMSSLLWREKEFLDNQRARLEAALQKRIDQKSVEEKTDFRRYDFFYNDQILETLSSNNNVFGAPSLQK